ncbi:MAG TPA: RHS repeat-associated core domain-containing protein, partial [Ktedonosporobacter sp.]|nr:RHS repeat-associated core domain-containing protein [Ktedonosporobacter sp.]
GGLSGSYTFVYDQRGQQTSMTTTINGTNYPVQASYDDAGDLISQTYPTGEVVNATYSAQGWLSQLSTTSGGTTTTLASNISYTGTAGAAMHITGMSLGNGVYSYGASYDLDQRLISSSLTRSSDSTLLDQTQPGYDGVGNVTSVTTTLQAGTDNQHFCYDEQNRLTWAWSNGNSPCGSFTAGTLTAAQYQQSYTYDTNGRLTSAQSGYTYGDSHHLHAVTATGSGYSAAYDAAGNMTCRAPSSATTCAGTQTGQQLSYDAEGNLSTWQNQPSPTSTVNYLYDGEGTRVASQLVSGGNTTLTSYIGKLETVVTGSSTTTTTYYTAGGLRIAEAVNGTFSYLGNDVLGSVAVALNAAGQLTAAQLYGPYGNVRYSSGTMPTDIGFTGQRGDSATGLDYYGARYYDPVVGLFISADQERHKALLYSI